MDLKVNDYVKVKEGVNLESGEPAVDWAGKITEIYTGEKTALVILDSRTLDSLDDQYLLECLEDGAEPFEYIFLLDDLIRSNRRDSDRQMEEAVEQITQRLMELDDDGEDASFERRELWTQQFCESDFFHQLDDYQQEHAGFVVSTFLNYMYDYAYVTPEAWNESNIREVCLEVVPRKITAEISLFENYGAIVIAFLKFLEAEGHMPETGKLQGAVEKIKDRIPKLAADSSNWGMAKSMMMGARDAGVDPTEPDALNAYLTGYNQELLNDLPEVRPLKTLKPVPEDPYGKIGRNDKISVRYEDGTVKKNVKFKVVERDLREGRCVLVK